MIYKSKISIRLVLFLLIIMGGTGTLMVYHAIWIGFVVILVTSVFIAYSILTTYYRIENKTLNIKSGIFVNQTVAIENIRKICETNNPISSPATSLDRIEIFYNKFDTIIISPKEKLKFLEHIKTLNPAVDIEFQRG